MGFCFGPYDEQCNFFMFMLFRFTDVVIVSSRDSLDGLFWLAIIDVWV